MRYVSRPKLKRRGFRRRTVLPYGMRVGEIEAAMQYVYDFFYDINRFLVQQGWGRLEELLSAAPAAFSGLISEIAVQGISKHSLSVTRNRYHNGRPDLVPNGYYPDDSVLAGSEGLEVKSSRNPSGWQGHNVESGWLIIFQYSIDTETQPIQDRSPTFFQRTLAAQLEEDDWGFSGRTRASRRTITASILRSGLEKLLLNPVYQDPAYAPPRRRPFAKSSVR